MNQCQTRHTHGESQVQVHLQSVHTMEAMLYVGANAATYIAVTIAGTIAVTIGGTEAVPTGCL